MSDHNQPRANPKDAPSGRQKSSWFRLHRAAVIATGIGLMLSLIAAYAVDRWEERVNRVEFDGVAATELIVLQNLINDYVNRLETLRTLFESANEEITRSEFEVFSQRLFENHLGILRAGWIPRINRKERAEYETAAIADGVAGYRIKTLAADGELSAAPMSDEYFPIFFSTEAKTSGVYGLDYSTDPSRRATMERARDTDQVTVVLTKLFSSLKSQNQTNVILVCVPVYAKGTSRTTIADRRRNLAGYVVGIFDLQPMLQSIQTATSPDIYVSAYPPEPGNSAEHEYRFVPDFSSTARATQSREVFAIGPRWSAALRIGDANWQMLAVPAASGRLIVHHDRTIIVLGSGIFITIFVVIYLGLASRNSRQIELANLRVLELARTDILTGLPNRAFFLEQLEEIKLEHRYNGAFSVMMLDLDRFKNVNDSLGHASGDILLRQVADRLKSALRGDEILARFGGDEFAVVLRGCADQKRGSVDLATRISRCISEPFQLPGREVQIGTSIGIALAPEQGNGTQELLKKADLALYRSKAAGRNCFTLYDDAMSAELQARNMLENDLRDGIALCQFEVHYQVVTEIETEQRRGFEALVRWRHPTRGLIPPDQFIPLAEETGLIVALGEWVLRRACDDAKSWPEDIKVAVNLSPVQLKQSDLFDVIQSALLMSGLPPERLEIEVTESVLLEKGIENHTLMQRLKSIGISLALDDFGTGHSSLSCLTAFPFDKIKIDKSFIANLARNHKSPAIVSSIVTLARGLAISITAEGVETHEQLEMLRTLGVNFAQGYLFGRPVPIIEVDNMFNRSRKNAA